MGKHKKAGRPERLPTEKEITGLCKVISLAGTTDHEAYTLADVPKTTFYLWIEKGKAARDAGADPKKDRFLSFLNRIEHAKTERTTELLERIRDASKDPKNWQAALAMLRITDQKRFGDRVRVLVEEELTDALARLKKRLPAPEYERALSAIVEGDGGE